MKRNSPMLAAALAVALTACGSQDADRVDSSSSTSTEPTQVAEPASQPAPQFNADVTFDGNGIDLPFEVVQRYDRVRQTSKSKRDQRQVYFEALGGDVPGVVQQVGTAMQSAGYKQVWERQEYGGTRVKFTKSGTQAVTVLVRDGVAGPKLREELATASVYFTVIEPPTAS